jgi:hypothetical protein
MVVERKDVKGMLVRLLDYGVGGKPPSNGVGTITASLLTPPERSPA